MFCPWYKNKEVFDGFNEMVEAFGGRPLTEEEFESEDLRNLRTGSDYSAMDTAYLVYDRNGGNFLNKTPDGKDSLLFLTLLDYFGNRKDAIVAKSNVYSDEFTEWFGDWWGPLNVQDEDVEFGPVSKVVDENGEPLVVWHGNRTKEKIKEFKKDKIGSEHKKIIDGFWFITNKNLAKEEYAAQYEDFKHVGYGEVLPVYLNFKNPVIDRQKNLRTEDSPYGKMDIADERFLDFIDRIQLNSEQNDGFIIDVVDSDGFADPFYQSIQRQLIAKNANQIKHVKNLGEFNPENPNIYHLDVSEKTMLDFMNQHNRAGISSSFGQEIAIKLINGEKVSSKDIVKGLQASDSFSKQNRVLSDILGLHDVPVVLDDELDRSTLATTEIFDDGKCIIRVNSSLIDQVTQGFLSEAILHEIVHAVTSKAFILNQTQELRNFVSSTNRCLEVLMKAFRGNYTVYTDIDSVRYAMKNDREFAAVFITDAEARNEIFSIAKLLDLGKHNLAVNSVIRMINSIARLFSNKSLIENNEAVMKDYQNIIVKHLKNLPIIEAGKALTKEEVRTLKNSLDKQAIYNQKVINLSKHAEKLVNVIEANNINVFKKYNKTSFVRNNESFGFDSVINSLKIRTNSIRTSNLSDADKSKLITDTLIQIDMLENNNIAKYVAILSMLSLSVPVLLEDIKELRSILNADSTPDAKDIMYQYHGNFKTYQDIISSLSLIFNLKNSVQDIVDGYNKNVSDEKGKITQNDVFELKQIVEDTSALITDGISIIEILLDKYGTNLVIETGEKVNNPDINEFINSIISDPSKISTGVGWFLKHFAPMDAANNVVIRTMEYLLNNAVVEADDMVTDKITELTKILAKLKPGESVLDLYEYDDKKRTTGWLVRDRNFGKFYNKYDAEIRRINQIIKDKYNLVDLDVDTNKTAPYKDGAREEWNKLKNDWCRQYAERPMLPEYYEMWASVSQTAKSALGAINTEISAILSKKGVIDSKGHRHLDLLSDSEFELYQDLCRQKRILADDHDENGRLKTGEELKIAKELQNVYLKLDEKSGSKKLKVDKKAWERELYYNIDNVWGGREEYNKYINGEKNSFDVASYKKWHSRNSIRDFKRDSEGNAKIWNIIEQEMGDDFVDYGEDVAALLEERRRIYRLYRGVNSEVQGSKITSGLKATLLNLDIKISVAKRKAKSKNKQLQASSAKRRKIIKKYIKFVPTDEFIRLRDAAQKAANDAGNELLFYKLMQEYGHSYVEAGVRQYERFSYFTKSEAIDDAFMEYVPNFSWVERDDSRFKNPKFDESYGTNMIPKKIKEFDNTEAYNKVTKPGTAIAELYEAIKKTYELANAMQTNRLYVDNYLLSQKAGSVWKKMKHHGLFGWFPVLVKHVFEKIGLGIGKFSRSVTENDFADIGSQMALDIVDQELGISVGKAPIKGVWPDGREFHIIPQYYTRRLDDPSQLSADLIGITMDYYKMSCYYNAKQKIKDDLELLLDYMNQKKFKPSGVLFSNKTGEYEDENPSVPSGVEAARTFLEMNLYDMRRKQSTWFKNTPFEFTYTKVMNLWKDYTTVRNLGYSAKIALVGMMTTLHAHNINMMVGLNYNLRNSAEATLAVLKHIYLKKILGARIVGDSNTDDIVTLILEKYNVANQKERKMTNTNRPRITRVLSTILSPFGMLSHVDYITKAIIAVSILMNYRKVGNTYMSSEDIKNSRYLYTDKEFKEKYDEYKKGKSLFYDLNVEENKLVFPDGYNDHVNKVVTNKIQKISEYCDGMATPMLRAACTRTWVGCFIMIHKQFLPLILQRSFGKRVYDYDMEQYKNGVFRTVFLYAYEVMKNNFLAGTALGGVLGLAFFSNPYVIGGSAIAGGGINLYNKYLRYKYGGKPLSMKEINRKWFKDFSDPKSTKNSYMNRYSFKEFMLKVLTYHIIALGVNAICAKADDDDDDNQILLFIAMILRNFLWESYSEFRLDDIANTFKSPSPALGTLDAAKEASSSFVQLLIHTVSPLANFLDYPSLLYEYGEDMDEIITTPGAYEDMTKFDRFVIKATPFKNIIEQLKDSERKRRYFENQIMHIKKKSEIFNEE